MGKLTITDLDILIDALGAWEKMATSPVGLMESIIKTIIPFEIQDTEEFRSAREEQMEATAAEARAQVETATLLKAKLIEMKNEFLAANLTGEVDDDDGTRTGN